MENSPDPFDWSVDEVVAYLCHGSFDAWARSATPSPRPDPTILEKALRENDVTGDILLTEVNKSTLAEDLALRSLGQRSTILQAILYLRTLSRRYSEVASQTNLEPALAPPFAEFSSQAPQSVASINSPNPFLTPRVIRPPRPTPRLESNQNPRTQDTPRREPDHPNPSRKDEEFVVTEEGKKRRRLDLSRTTAPSFNPLVPQPTKRQYYDDRRLTIEDVFYNSPPGDNDDDDDEFCFVRNDRNPRGRALFINQCFRHSLQQAPQSLQIRGGKTGLAVVPYSKPIYPRGSPRYFNLFVKSDGKTIVRREDISQWPQLSHGDTMNYLLAKYPPQHESIALPLYGDSDPEEDYDSDTWNEIQGEKDKEIEEPDRIPPTEVDAIIDGCVNSYVERWRTESLPTSSRKAWKIWSQSRAKRTRIVDIRVATQMVAHLDSRIEALRKAIGEERWTKAADLQQQCGSMEPTVVERESQMWRVSILQLSTCPPKPPKGAKAVPRRSPRNTILQDGEESLGCTDESSDAESDFIVPDEAPLPEDLPESYPQELPVIAAPIEDESEDEILPPGRRRKGVESGIFRDLSSQNIDHLPSSPSRLMSSPLKVPFKDIEVVDLTKSDDELTESNDTAQNEFEVKTPPLNPINTHNDSLIDTPSQTKLDAIGRFGEKSRLPPFTDVDAIRELNVAILEERRDRKRLLAHLIYIISDKERFELYHLLRSTKTKVWKKRTQSALRDLLNKPKDEKKDKREAQLYLRIASLYISWNTCKKQGSRGIYKKDVDAAMGHNGFTIFHNHLTEILHSCCSPAKKTVSKREASYEAIAQLPQVSKKVASMTSDLAVRLEGKQKEERDDKETEEVPSESNQEPVSNISPRKKRKRPVKQSQEAKNTQMRAQQRMEHQEAQQKRLFRKLESLGIENDDPERKIVNLEEPIIYLDPHIGRRVKEHQLAGIRFIWREIIKDEKHQGCLLAHTMGLGKTMQVISFLVTLAKASNSSDPAVKAQIPESLRTSRTLVLCPSSLVDNWLEEFLMWTPRDKTTRQNLGEIRRVTSANSSHERQYEISTWRMEGGVLLMSYDLFRRFVLPSQASSYSSEDSERLRNYLTEGPSIIVADEAHKMKDPKSAIGKATSMFKSKSRIALTGSPLANNLYEYYTMIDWISPRYLGDLTQFKAKYVEPITEGSYSDSNPSERRRALKILQVLKTDLEPKVNRADISVIENSLPQKVEFVITVPLTALQEEAHNMYIEDLSMYKEGKGSEQNARILNWLSILDLLCNHPSCFLDKINPQNNPQKPKNIARESDSETTPDDELAPQMLPTSLSSRMKELFSSVENPMCPSLSHRTRIFDQIIDESINAGDKVLVFSHSIPTLGYLEFVLKSKNRSFCRLDGKTPIPTRQTATKAFNKKDSTSHIYLISTTAGGLGLNIPGANRVIIFDFKFNPTWEEQAVGRAYRIGQRKNVFVYRFLTGGTYQNTIHNQTVFKTQLSYRVVDKKNTVQWASKFGKSYLVKAKNVEQEDLSEFRGKDPLVLDKILSTENQVRKIELTETFQRESNEKLTPEEEKEIKELLNDERLKRNNPEGWARKQFEIERKRAANLSRPAFPTHMPPPMVQGHSIQGPLPPIPGFSSNVPPAPAPDVSHLATPTVNNNPAILRWNPPNTPATRYISTTPTLPTKSAPQILQLHQRIQSEAANALVGTGMASHSATDANTRGEDAKDQPSNPVEKPNDISTKQATE